jgi:16S rRNA (adenine1518-N6/adenine1519-N6)-dimethyltransferase
MASNSPKSLLLRLGLKPKKALGQHFLLHPHQAQRIVAALDLTTADTVVEIGAGLGALTSLLAQSARRIIALERDPALAHFLQTDLLAETPNVEILCQDVLEFDFIKASQDAGRPLAVVGNLPYQITSPLLFRLIEVRPAISRAVLMMQQEVGARLLAKPATKDYGILSVLGQYYFQITRLFSLSPGNFFPPPQVDSIVLRLKPAPLALPARDETLLHQVVKTAFGHRRKTLNNTLVAHADSFGLNQETMRDLLTGMHVDLTRRGETLTVAEFVTLCNKITALKGQPAA